MKNAVRGLSDPLPVLHLIVATIQPRDIRYYR